MKKISCVFGFVCLLLNYLHGQTNNRDLEPYLLMGKGIEQVFWPDTVMAHHSLKFGNQVHILDKKHKDGKIYRYVYYPDGSLKLVAEIKSGIISTDTITMPRSTAPYAIFDTIINIMGDYCNGKYTEYWPGTRPGNDPFIRYKGQYKEGEKVGEWTEYLENDEKIVSHFDDNGFQVGSYTEYYDNDTIKWKGQYGLQKIGNWSFNYDKQGKKFEPVKLDLTESVRTGRWFYYNKRGELIQTVEYNWPAKN